MYIIEKKNLATTIISIHKCKTFNIIIHFLKTFLNFYNKKHTYTTIIQYTLYVCNAYY